MYQAKLFSFDGESVTDFRDKKTKQEVWNRINDMGSRWIFYPLCFVATDKTIVDTPDGLEFLRGKRIKTVIKYLEMQWNDRKDEICELVNDGAPLSFVFDFREI